MTPVEFADKWVGVPFRWDGREASGVDCYGLVIAWSRDVLGKDIPDWRPESHKYISVARAIEAHYVDAVRPAEFHQSDIAIAYGTKVALHMGIVISGKILHVSIRRGVIIERKPEFESVWSRVEYGVLAL